MEIRVSLVLLAVLALMITGLTATGPAAVYTPAGDGDAELMAMEDRFASEPGDLSLARGLASRYLDAAQPGLAVAALRRADQGLLRDPLLTHRLAQAYEELGNVRDAQATASLALARCQRALGTGPTSAISPAPQYGCSERALLSLQMHQQALSHMLRWGVTDPRRDSRGRLAYQLAQRRASIASLSLQ